MIKLEQKGFTLIEMLISIGILGIIAPLLVVALFQILTFTERGRAGFEAQADTRNASSWMSQDIVMARETNLFSVGPLDLKSPIANPDCADPETDWATFTWTDYFDDRNDEHTVSYCLRTDPLPAPGDPDTQCPPSSPCLVRNYLVIDSEGNTTSEGSLVIARHIASVIFQATAERDISVEIRSAPENRFGVDDEKTFKVMMRPTI